MTLILKKKPAPKTLDEALQPIKKMFHVGLDVSTHTGMVVLSDESIKAGKWVFHSTNVLESDTLTGLKRAMHIRDQVRQHMPPRGSIVSIMIEGYGFASNTLATSVEIGTLVREFIMHSGAPVYVVAPGTLKKFVTGQGNVQKNVMLKEGFKRFGLDFSNDNEMDAALLAIMGFYASYPQYHKDIPHYARDALTKISPLG